MKRHIIDYENDQIQKLRTFVIVCMFVFPSVHVVTFSYRLKTKLIGHITEYVVSLLFLKADSSSIISLLYDYLIVCFCQMFFTPSCHFIVLLQYKCNTY